MVLEKPHCEECGNCRFCLSHIIEVTQYATPFLQTQKVGQSEKFWCHRNAPLPNIEGYICGRPSTFPMVNPKGWCGEWDKRKE